jgi:hypothetical protein
MNKDIIYIDVEDDITAIIGKVKQSREKIVALVPPKRIGVLQSAVNLRLLNRTATQNGKHLVLISGNAALTALAAAAKIPVAKNLQSKPEIGVAPTEDASADEDIIDGSQLPVGELARTADRGLPFSSVSPAVDEAVRENAAEETSASSVARPRPVRTRGAAGVKVPNFDRFRKKLLWIGAGGALLVVFLVWAIVYAPRANVVISARTTDTPVNARVTLDPATTTNLQEGTIKSITKQTKKDQTVDFAATGKKDVGTKATGSMKLTRTNPSATPLIVPEGTEFTASGLTFVSTQAATLSSQLTSSGFDPGSATVSVQATDIGDNYNLSARGYASSMNGVSATGSDMAGGTRKTVTVVSEDDIKKATEQLAEQKTDDIKSSLTKQFDGTFIVVGESFKIDQATPASTPALGQESSDGKAKLTSSITYSLSAIAKSEAKLYLDEYFKVQLKGKSDQRVYDNGSDEAKLSNITPGEGGKVAANLVASAKIGPKINDDDVKKLAAGKRYGEIQASLEAIQGVDSVDVKYSPFWVTSAPKDTKRISVEFKLTNE